MAAATPCLVLVASGVLLLTSIACAQSKYAQAQRVYEELGLDGATAKYMPAARTNDSEAEFAVGAMYVFAASAAKDSEAGWARARHFEHVALSWFRRSQQHGNKKAEKLVNIVNANDTSVLYVSLQYVMNGTKPPPESSFPSHPSQRYP
jgi:hypothetical protein